MLYSVSYRLCPAGDLQLGEDVTDVGLHRGEADHQGLGDLREAFSLHQCLP